MDIYKAKSILNVSTDSTMDDIKASYKRLVKEKHPDKGGTTEEFKRINDAYNLCNSIAIVDKKPKKEWYKILFEVFLLTFIRSVQVILFIVLLLLLLLSPIWMALSMQYIVDTYGRWALLAISFLIVVVCPIAYCVFKDVTEERVGI